MHNVVIVSGSRTPIGAYGGMFKSIPVADLGAVALKETLKKSGLRPVASKASIRMGADAIRSAGPLALEARYHDYDETGLSIMIDQVIMGNVLGAGQGQNIARQALIRAGIPKETCATTVNKLCASGMEAVAFGYQAIRSGGAEVVLAGGMENMSMTPYAMPAARWGQRMGDGQLLDLMIYDGLFEIFYGYHMGITAENIADRYGISRQEQDELGVISHHRALRAISKQAFKNEIAAVNVPQKQGAALTVALDERPLETSLEKMARLRPAFKKNGTVTAGNASGINDAAAALLIMSEKKATALGLTPLVRIKAHASAGLDPAYMGLGPIPAVRKLMHNCKLAINDFDRIELNEAFAVQAIACMRELRCDMEKTNVCGSGISLGHPIGCTGARIIVTLINQMVADDFALGLAALCIGGGQGMAMAFERV